MLVAISCRMSLKWPRIAVLSSGSASLVGCEPKTDVLVASLR